MKYRIADGHTDFLMHLNLRPEFLSADIAHAHHVCREGLVQGGVGLQIFAVFNDSAKHDATLGALEQIDCFYQMLDAWDEAELLQANTVDAIGDGNKVYAMLGIEGADALQGSLKALHVFRRLGVKLVTLLWNHENAAGYPAMGGSEKGLKPFGKDLVREMNQSKMIIDVSHLNRAGFWDVMELSAAPVMASHSNAYALCLSPRNLNDEQIQALIQANGYIGLNLCAPFLNTPSPVYIADVVRHALYILELGGEHVLGMGSDFDGITDMPQELKGVQDFPLIMQALEQEGLDKKTLHNIACGNMQRFVKQFYSA